MRLLPARINGVLSSFAKISFDTLTSTMFCLLINRLLSALGFYTRSPHSRINNSTNGISLEKLARSCIRGQTRTQCAISKTRFWEFPLSPPNSVYLLKIG